MLLLSPNREYAITELAERIDAPVSTTSNELERLVAAGIVRVRQVGRTRLVSANTDTRLNRPLTDLIAVTYGPLAIVAEEFAEIPHADLVLIYGSWAARYEGQHGPPPNDVDVMVVGEAPRSDVYDAAERAQRRLGLPVNPTMSSRQRWTDARDALIQQIQASAYTVVLDRQPGGSG